MTISKEVKKEIEDYLTGVMDNKIENYEPETSYAPFIASLIRDNTAVAAYSLIHSIQTSMGMSMYEQVSKIIADGSGFDGADIQWKAPIGIARARIQMIDQIVTDIRNGDRTADRQSEQNDILSINDVDRMNREDGRTVDVHLVRGGREFWFDLKTVKPNAPGFLGHKRKILEWIARANQPIVSAIVFPYNPYHPRRYQRAGFDVLSNDDVMIGSDYWDFLGGKGCYMQVLNSFNKAGKDRWPELEKMM